LDKNKFEILKDYKGEEEYIRPLVRQRDIMAKRLKSNYYFLFFTTILIVSLLCIIIMPYFIHVNPFESFPRIRNLPPMKGHWFGTDTEGKDMLQRVLLGGRTSLLISVGAAFLNSSIGIIFGAICGYTGGLMDDIVMRIVEIISSIPNLLIVILLSLILGQGVLSLILAMSITGWCGIMRIIRGQILQLKEQEYVMAAQALGANTARILSKHLLINLINVGIVSFTLEIPTIMLNEIILTYMGLGVGDKILSWGQVFKAARDVILFYPYQVLYPGIVVSLIIISFNVIGDALADAVSA